MTRPNNIIAITMLIGVFAILLFVSNIRHLIIKNIKSTGVITDLNPSCTKPYQRCSVNVIDDHTGNQILIVFDSYQNHDWTDRPNCLEWYPVEEKFAVGQRVKFNVFGPYQYSELGNNDNYEVCKLTVTGVKHPAYLKPVD